MARKPGPTPVSFNSGAILTYADDISFEFLYEDFNREEFSPQRLLRAKDETTFAEPIIVKNAVNAPVQIGMEPCGFNNPVYLGPEDDYLDSILRRWNISQFTLTGAPSSPSAIDSLRTIAIDHKKRLDKFQAYQDSLSRDVSYQYLIALQSETFAYLQGGLTLTMSAINISASNCLISQFNEGVVHENRVSSTALSVGWSATIQVRSDVSRNSLT